VISDLGILAVEVGYVAGVAALTKALLVVTRRVERWRTASSIHALLKSMEQPTPVPNEPRGYRTNAVLDVPTSPPATSSSWLSRRRAVRAARYVQKLEDEATMKG
jgi:hypothetical protein